MTFARALIRDLIERRLWPIALALVVALAAVPVVLGGGGEPAAPVATPATPAGGDGASPAATYAKVQLDESVPVRRARGGEVRNPFKRPASATVAEDPATAQTPSTTTTGSSIPDLPTTTSGGTTGATATFGGSRPSGAATTGGGSGPSRSATGDGSSKPRTTYHVTLRFGQTATKLKTIRDLPRLSPLPSITDPFFVFLGVLDGGKRAVFMVSSDATPIGDGVCKPKLSDCQTVELAADQTEWFDFTNPDGTVTQYQMDLVSIRKVNVASEAKVRAAFARHSRVGVELLRDAAVKATSTARGAKRYRYLPKRGVLVRAKKRKRATALAAAGAFLPGAAEVLTLAPRRQQPGIPVWHWDADQAER